MVPGYHGVARPLPSVSVVIPAYRQARFIEGALASVAAQTYRGSIETVVVDDGCPERSGEIAARHPIGAKVVHQANRGVAQARNRGIKESNGELLAFLDGDDRWHPDKLAAQVQDLLAAGAPAMSFTRYRFIDPQGNPFGADYPAARLEVGLPELARRNFVGCSTVLVHRGCVERVGGFPDSAEFRRGGQDYALWLKIALLYPIRYLKRVLTDYSVHPGSRVGKDAVKNFEGAVFALRDFAAFAPSGIKKATGRSLSSLLVRRSFDMFRDLGANGSSLTDLGDGARALLRALC